MNFQNAEVLAQTTTTSAAAFASDFLVVLILFAVVLAFAFRSGRRGIIALTFSTYIGITLYNIFPYKEMILGWTTQPLTSLILLVAMVLIFIAVPYLILKRIIVTEFLGRGKLFFSAVLSFLITTTLLASAYHLLPVREYYVFTPALDRLFMPEEFLFWWLIAPIVALWLLVR